MKGKNFKPPSDLFDNRYRMMSPIGAGNMGTVSRAFDTRLTREIALKTIAPQWANNATAKKRFSIEACAVAALDHPGICTVYDVGTSEDGLEYFTMELLTGTSLDKYVATRGPLPQAELAHVGWKITDAMAAAHAVSVIHRDLKLANIVLDRHGNPKVCDWGVCLVETHSITEPGHFVGTPLNMPPEQFQNAVTPACDVFALGVVLFELATGVHPFLGPTLEITALRKSCYEARPADFRADLDPRITSLIVSMMSKDLAQRPSMAEAADKLRAVSLAFAAVQTTSGISPIANERSRVPASAIVVGALLTMAATMPSAREAIMKAAAGVLWPTADVSK